MKLLTVREHRIMVDDEDYKCIMRYQWTVRTTKTGVSYAYRCEGAGKLQRTISMHQQIAGTPSGKDTDHRNGNGLDNQRHNLRVATRSQNMANRGKQSNNTSGIKGVCWDKSRLKWLAQIAVNRKRIWLGRFQRVEDAAAAYRKAELEHFGEFARCETKFIATIGASGAVKGIGGRNAI